MRSKNKQRGINLIELMIVIAIIGIIAAFAYPSYLNQIRDTRRADCSGALVSLGNAMERHYSVTGAYLGAAAGGADTGAPVIFPVACPVDGGTATYNITIQAASPKTSFRLDSFNDCSSFWYARPSGSSFCSLPRITEPGC